MLVGDLVATGRAGGLGRSNRARSLRMGRLRSPQHRSDNPFAEVGARAEQGHWWKVEHLAHDRGCHFHIGKAITEVTTTARRVDHRDVRMRALRPMTTRVSGLLLRLSPRPPPA